MMSIASCTRPLQQNEVSCNTGAKMAKKVVRKTRSAKPARTSNRTTSAQSQDTLILLAAGVIVIAVVAMLLL